MSALLFGLGFVGLGLLWLAFRVAVRVIKLAVLVVVVPMVVMLGGFAVFILMLLH